MQLEPCAQCKRHVAVDAVACPFCGAPIAPAPTRVPIIGRFSRAAIFAGATTLAGCHTGSTQATTPAETVKADATANDNATSGTTTNEAIGSTKSEDTLENDATTNTTTAAPDPMTPEPTPDPNTQEAVKSGKVAVPKPGTGTIYGVLLDERGKPARNAVISVYRAGRTTTDAHGKFVFPDLPPGTYTVTFQEPANPRANRNEMRVLVKAGLVVEANGTLYPEPVDRGPCCKPYGAPPARRRVV